MTMGNIRVDSGFTRPRPREKSYARTAAHHPQRAATCGHTRYQWARLARGHARVPAC